MRLKTGFCTSRTYESIHEVKEHSPIDSYSLKLDFWLFKNRNIMFEELNIYETIHLHISHFLNIFLSIFGQSKGKFQAHKEFVLNLRKTKTKKKQPIKTPNVKTTSMTYTTGVQKI
jgi:hypothetical protein